MRAGALQARDAETAENLHHGAALEELGHLIGESHEQGQLPKDTAALLDHALEFSDRTLDEVMVPRVEAVFVRDDASLAEADAGRLSRRLRPLPCE